MKKVAIILGVVLVALLGVGVALFKIGGLGYSCATVAEVDMRSYDAALSDYGDANKALSARKYPLADSLMDRAIADLGDSYTDKPGQDDTVTVLAAAKGATAGGDFQLAAHIKQEVLATRLALFQKEDRMAQRCRNLLQRLGMKR
ncbi:MAG TPA: hypothetical protein VFI23_07565 [Rhizomicrobium sp.]|nr:hypothetical protein [Rhizomicrobium sp.]